MKASDIILLRKTTMKEESNPEFPKIDVDNDVEDTKQK